MSAIRSVLIVSAGLALGAAALGSASAEGPNSATRYSFEPAEGGFLRLDRETGATSFCRAEGEGYACAATREGGVAADAERIRALEARVAELEARLKAEGLKPDRPAAQLELPTDEQMDRIAGFLRGAMKRMKSIVRELEIEENPQGERL